MQRKPRLEKQRRHQARKSRVVRRIAASPRPRLTSSGAEAHLRPARRCETGHLITVSPARRSWPRPGNVEAARRVGQAFAGQVRARQIDEVVFNRNGFLYHGRVKALAEAAREAGLKF
jgi:large subunit ribosomal protein L18